jgi:IS30 family transposase
MPIYFCDPHSPWQRPTNENTNGLLHQYLSRKADLAKLRRHELEAIAATLNKAPRKTMGLHTPTEALTKLLCEHSSRKAVASAP